MRFLWLRLAVLAAGMAAVTAAAFSQTAPAYERKGGTLFLGAGPSNFNVDWGHGRMYGVTAWGDWYPAKMPSLLRGLGVEGELRDISFNRSDTQPNLRMDTAGIGAIYAWKRFRGFHPYLKYMIAYGSMDFVSPSPSYSHDTRTLSAGGGGLEFHVYHEFWVRADYEYQIWQTLLGKTPDPQGFTLGVAYDLAHRHPRKR